MKLKIEIYKIIAWFSKLIDKSEAFAITGINTTLISFISACILAYVVFVYSSIQNAELKAFDEANKINNILFAVHDCPFRVSEKNEVFDKKRLLKIIDYTSMLGSYVSKPEIIEKFNEAKDLSLPKDVDKLSEKALGAMSCLVGQYPFPVIISKNKENKYTFNRDSKPIIFANLNEIRLWIASMNEIIRAFSSELRGTGKLLDLLTEFSKGEFATNQRNSIMKYPTTSPMLSRPMIRGAGRPFYTLGALDPVFVYNDFRAKIIEAQNIVWSTSNYVKRVDALARGYPSKPLLRWVFILIFIAFGFGVIYPIVAERVRRTPALWVPLFIYIVIGILIVKKIFW